VTSLALCGVGRMGRALLDGWVTANTSFSFTLFEPNATAELVEFAKAHNIALNPQKISGGYDIVVMAVKPQMFGQIAGGLFSQAISAGTLFISVMAGISVENIKLSTNAKAIIRAMPNTPGQIGQGVTAFFANENCTAQNLELALLLLSPLGTVEALSEEDQINAVTAVSGSGPAYLFLLTEALEAAAIKQGLPKEMASKLARQTIIGSAGLLSRTGKTAEALRLEVTSPKGTTEAALEILMRQNGLKDLVQSAVEAATKRSIELGRK